MIATGYPTVVHANLTKQLYEPDILYHYLGVDKLPTVINSPLRADNSPSFGLVLSEQNKVYYVDFATRETGDLFALLGNLWHCDYYSVLQRINADLVHILTDAPIKKEYSYVHKSINHSPLDRFNVSLRPFKDYDYTFWSSYGINKDWLEFGRIYPISHILLNSSEYNYVISAEQYAYVYVETKDSIPTIKVYQPYSVHFKWRNLHDSSVWDLWAQLPPTGDRLIITSSRKDALSLWANTGIPATGLQAESYLPKPHVIQELKNRFKKVYILYDNDYDKPKNYGRNFGALLAKQFGLKQIEIPEKYQSKDPSDLYKNHGPITQINTIKKLL